MNKFLVIGLILVIIIVSYQYSMDNESTNNEATQQRSSDPKKETSTDELIRLKTSEVITDKQTTTGSYIAEVNELKVLLIEDNSNNDKYTNVRIPINKNTRAKYDDAFLDTKSRLLNEVAIVNRMTELEKAEYYKASKLQEIVRSEIKENTFEETYKSTQPK